MARRKIPLFINHADPDLSPLRERITEQLDITMKRTDSVGHIFISHSSRDNAFTRFLADSLTLAGFDVWVDFDDITSGDRWVQTIQKAVEDCESIIVVMSRAARDSEWVERESLLAMDLGKRLYIALIEDMPLPLHLLNRQFTDFRNPDDKPRQQTARKLAAALRKSPPRTSPKKLSAEPDRDNFFKYLEQLPGANNAVIARDLYRWAKDYADTVEFGGKITPCFHARVQLGDQQVIVFSVWAYARQPAVQVQFQYLMDHQPYDDARLRKSTLWSLNRVAPRPLMNDQAHRRPTIPLESLARGENLAQFKQIMAEIIDNLRSV